MAAPTIKIMFSILCLNIVLVITAADLGPSWNHKELLTVRQGDSVNLTCSGGKAGLTDILRVQIERQGSENPSVVTDNSYMKPAYHKLGRLRVLFNIEKGSTTLIYTGIRGEDAGMYGCYRLSNTDQVALMKVNVLVPVESVALYKLSNGQRGIQLNSDEDLLLVQNSAGSLQCIVTMDGSLIPPTVSVLLDDSSNVTNMFVRNVRNETKGRDSDDDVGVFSVVTVMTYNMAKPDRKWNGRTLKCSAKSEGFNEVSASTGISVQYAPVISCPRTAQSIELGASVSWFCDIESNPGAELSWLRGHNNSDLAPLNSTNTLTTVKPMKADLTRVTLSINRLDHSHYTSYHLTAANELGSSNVTLTLYPPGTVLADSAAYPHSTSGIGTLSSATPGFLFFVLIMSALQQLICQHFSGI